VRTPNKVKTMAKKIDHDASSEMTPQQHMGESSQFIHPPCANHDRMNREVASIKTATAAATTAVDDLYNKVNSFKDDLHKLDIRLRETGVFNTVIAGVEEKAEEAKNTADILQELVNSQNLKIQAIEGSISTWKAVSSLLVKAFFGVAVLTCLVFALDMFVQHINMMSSMKEQARELVKEVLQEFGVPKKP